MAACRALANDNVQDALQARQAADATRLSLRREDALQGLLDGIELARAQGNPAAMISGWREIGRMLGFYEPDRAEVVVGVVDESRLMTSMNLMTDAELVALIAGQS